MASRSRRKSVSDSRNEDVISHLPTDIKERILEWLPTRDAARTALLSTHWRDVWLGHGRIVFDEDLLRWCVRKRKCKADKRATLVNMINDILLRHAGPVKKFTLRLNYSDPMPLQSDLDRWFLFLSRNGVEELNISISYPDRKYKLPSWIVLCRTIKQLVLCFFVFDCRINARCIFPGVTSLVFKHVDFKHNVNGIVYSIPNLEKLAFDSCEGISNLEISAPKLESLSVIGYRYEVELRWFKLKLHLKAIKILCLDASLLWCKNVKVAALTFPTAINLQVIKLYYLSFASGEQLTGAMQLLQKSPNLCELEIIASNSPYSSDDIEAASRLLEDPESCIINQDLKMLNTVKIEWFGRSTLEMLFVKMLLSKSPALERVVIQESYNMDASMAVKNLRELLMRFPCASPEAQIVCMDCKAWYKLVDYPEF